MSNPAIPKLERIGAYIMITNVPQPYMQSQYQAAALIQKIIKEIRLGDAIKLQQAQQRRNEKKGKRK